MFTFFVGYIQEEALNFLNIPDLPIKDGLNSCNPLINVCLNSFTVNNFLKSDDTDAGSVDDRLYCDNLMLSNSDKPRFICERCSKTYSEKFTLRRHQQFECGQIPKFVCSYCHKRFKHKHHLTQHLGAVHFKVDVNPGSR